MWQDTTRVRKASWSEAKLYCKSLNLGKYSDWKLPSQYLLRRLSINKNRLKNRAYGKYWSSSPHSSAPSNAWYVDLSNREEGYQSKRIYTYVRCVHR